MCAQDEGKRTEVVSFKVTERVERDLMKLAARDDRTLSDFIYRLVRRQLYGDIGRLDGDDGQTET
jgi:hypothetical protein